MWRDAEPQAEALARLAAEAVFRHDGTGRGPGRPLEASIVLADDALVRDLNRTYRRQDRPTNVLSFANDGRTHGVGGPRLLGDVILARETVLREARDQGKSVAEHMSHLIVHGLLHLLGFDHDEARQAEQMEALEVAILAGIGIGDPYATTPVTAEASGARRHE
ncbi:MAG: rRNA maturation RNase YbeY [Kiloniellales bacterium]|nr:rRNA maturation RNase YbeY [Kiloniellales bacterium]